MRTLAESLLLALVRKGYEIDDIRQPIRCTKAGFVEFHHPETPSFHTIVKVWERFKQYDSQIVDLIAEAERARKDEWRKTTFRQNEQTSKPGSRS